MRWVETAAASRAAVGVVVAAAAARVVVGRVAAAAAARVVMGRVAAAEPVAATVAATMAVEEGAVHGSSLLGGIDAVVSVIAESIHARFCRCRGVQDRSSYTWLN